MVDKHEGQGRGDHKARCVTTDQWVSALRSGVYKQARSALRVFSDIKTNDAGKPDTEGCRRPKHCCLGVLADLMNPGGWSTDGLDDSTETEWGEGNDTAYVHTNTVNYTGPEWLDQPKARKLAEHNDAGESFDQMAKRIEVMRDEWVERHKDQWDV